MEKDNNRLCLLARFLVGIFLVSGHVCEAQDLWIGKILATTMCSEMSSFQTVGQLSGKRISDGGLPENRAKECEWYSWPKCATPGSCKHTTKNTCAGESAPNPEGASPPSEPPTNPPPGPPSGTPANPPPGPPSGTPANPPPGPSPEPSPNPPPGPPSEPPPNPPPGSPGSPPPTGSVSTGDGQMWIGKTLSSVMCGEMSSFQTMGQLSNKKITDSGLSTERKKECDWYSWPKCATPGSCKITTKNTCPGEPAPSPGPSPPLEPAPGPPSEPAPGPPSEPAPGPPSEPATGSPSEPPANPPTGPSSEPPPNPPPEPPGSPPPTGSVSTGDGQMWIGKTLSTVMCGEMSSFQTMGQLSNKKITDSGLSTERKKECDWYSWPKCATPGSCKITTKNTCPGEPAPSPGPSPPSEPPAKPPPGPPSEPAPGPPSEPAPGPPSEPAPVPPSEPASGPPSEPAPGPPSEPAPVPPSSPATGTGGQHWIGKTLSTAMCSEMSSFRSTGQLSNNKVTNAGVSPERKKECDWYSWPKCGTPGSCKLTTKKTC